MDWHPASPQGKSVKSGGSRRHVGGASCAAVKPWDRESDGRQPLQTMYAEVYVGIGLHNIAPKHRRGVRKASAFCEK